MSTPCTPSDADADLDATDATDARGKDAWKSQPICTWTRSSRTSTNADEWGAPHTVSNARPKPL